jgi:hypothetical protein
MAAFTPYRYPLMLLTLVLLGVAHFLAYKKSRQGAAKTNKAVLWVSTVSVIGMIAYTLVNKGL